MKIKVAIIGAGFGMYGLLPAFSKVSGCKVASICGESSERMLKYCRKYKVKRYDDWKEMLQNEKPGAVAIAVIPKYQYKIAKYALERGIAVFAEKPLTTSAITSEALARLAAKRRLPNVVDFIFPEIPQWRMAKKMIENGRIGRILGINADWRFMSYDLRNGIRSWKTDVKQGGGALSFYFSHTLYYMEYLVGRIKEMQCSLSTSKKSLNRGETTVNAAMLFENECIGSAHMDISHGGRPIHEIEIIGENGTITLHSSSNNPVDNFKLTLSTQRGIRKIAVNNETGSSEDPRAKTVRRIASRFIGWCNKSTKTKPDFKDGARTQKLVEMARASSSGHNK